MRLADPVSLSEELLLLNLPLVTSRPTIRRAVAQLNDLAFLKLGSPLFIHRLSGQTKA
jgi:hypothetical protein